jgi:hypothetical protein
VVERNARTVVRCSNERAGRSGSAAQEATWPVVLQARSSARSSSGAPTMRALSWLRGQVRAVTTPWRVANSTRRASRSPRRRGTAGRSWASTSRAARSASNASLLPPRRAGRLGRSTSPTPHHGGPASASARRRSCPHLDRKAPAARHTSAGEVEQPLVAGGVGSHHQLPQQPTDLLYQARSGGARSTSAPGRQLVTKAAHLAPDPLRVMPEPTPKPDSDPLASAFFASM